MRQAISDVSAERAAHYDTSNMHRDCTSMPGGNGHETSGVVAACQPVGHAAARSVNQHTLHTSHPHSGDMA